MTQATIVSCKPKFSVTHATNCLILSLQSKCLRWQFVLGRLADGERELGWGLGYPNWGRRVLVSFGGQSCVTVHVCMCSAVLPLVKHVHCMVVSLRAEGHLYVYVWLGMTVMLVC